MMSSTILSAVESIQCSRRQSYHYLHLAVHNWIFHRSLSKEEEEELPLKWSSITILLLSFPPAFIIISLKQQSLGFRCKGKKAHTHTHICTHTQCESRDMEKTVDTFSLPPSFFPVFVMWIRWKERKRKNGRCWMEFLLIAFQMSLRRKRGNGPLYSRLSQEKQQTP